MIYSGDRSYYLENEDYIPSSIFGSKIFRFSGINNII